MKKNNKNSKKVILLILDGWGIGKNDASNPIFLAQPQFINYLCKKYPHTKLCASGRCVGVPPYQVGNSEAGHLNIGAGRIVDQDVIKISQQINTGQFFKNPAFISAAAHVKKNKSALHIMGLLGNGQSPHSDPDHLLALLMFARYHKIKKVYLHLFTDGRDSPPRSALKSIMALERVLRPNEMVCTVMGRFYAMDRKKAWERTIRAYNTITHNHAEHRADSPQEGITRAYNANVTDEFIEPIIIWHKGKMTPRVRDNDAIIFFNLRSDRARQLTKPFVQPCFEKKNPGSEKYHRKKILKNIQFVAMTDFGPDLDNILSAYPSEDIKETLPILLHEKKQLYIAETEKYAHVTFFFNGGYAEPVNGENRIKIPSPLADSYDKTPAMSTAKITEKVIKSLSKYDFICANFACPDMIGHTGNMRAAIKTAKAVDDYVKKIVQAAFKHKATVVITADHGNFEYMKNLETNEIITEHTTNPVPLIIVSRDRLKLKKIKNPLLSNIAPTVLKLFNIKKSSLMNKESLI